MAITNSGAIHGPLPENFKAGTSVQTVKLNPEARYTLKHTGKDEDGNADTNTAYLLFGYNDAAVADPVVADKATATQMPLVSGDEFSAGPRLTGMKVITAAGAPVIRITMREKGN